MPDYRRTAEALFRQSQGRSLGEWVRERREAGKSWRTVTNELRDASDGVIDVAPQTLINWYEDRKAAA